MPILGKLQEFLDLSGVSYTRTVHPWPTRLGKSPAPSMYRPRKSPRWS